MFGSLYDLDSRSRQPDQQWCIDFYQQEEWSLQKRIQQVHAGGYILRHEMRTPVLRRVI